MADEIEIEILADGTIKSQTSKVSAQNHQNAEGFFAWIGKLTGGRATRDRRGTHAHVQHTTDTHTHQG
jgi:hypothetical protein